MKRDSCSEWIWFVCSLFCSVNSSRSRCRRRACPTHAGRHISSKLLACQIRLCFYLYQHPTGLNQDTLSWFPKTCSLLPLQPSSDIAIGHPGIPIIMPPKTTLTELNEGQIKFLFSVLKNCNEVKPDWNAVAAENGIGYARNA